MTDGGAEGGRRKAEMFRTAGPRRHDAGFELDPGFELNVHGAERATLAPQGGGSGQSSAGRGSGSGGARRGRAAGEEPGVATPGTGSGKAPAPEGPWRASAG